MYPDNYRPQNNVYLSSGADEGGRGGGGGGLYCLSTTSKTSWTADTS